MGEPYRYAKFRWWHKIDLEKVAKDLSEEFSVKKFTPPSDDMEMVLLKDERPELWIKADTLTAFVTIYQVNLFQNVAAPFTEKDVRLRNKMLELFNRKTGTPFPFGFLRREPKFKVEKS